MRPYFFWVMLHRKSAAAALQIYRTSEHERIAMTSISRSMLLAASLLALSVASALAQQDAAATKPDTTGYTKPTVTTPTGDSSMKGATVGDLANKAAMGSTDNSKTMAGEFTGPSGKQPK